MILHLFTLGIRLTCSSCKKWTAGSGLFHLADCFSSPFPSSRGWSVFIWKIYWLFWWDVGVKRCNGEQSVPWRWTDASGEICFEFARAAPPSLSGNESSWPLSSLLSGKMPATWVWLLAVWHSADVCCAVRWTQCFSCRRTCPYCRGSFCTALEPPNRLQRSICPNTNTSCSAPASRHQPTPPNYCWSPTRAADATVLTGTSTHIKYHGSTIVKLWYRIMVIHMPRFHHTVQYNTKHIFCYLK